MTIKTAITGDRYICALCGDTHKAEDFCPTQAYETWINRTYSYFSSNAIPAGTVIEYGDPTRIARIPVSSPQLAYCVYCHSRSHPDAFRPGTCGNCGAPR